MLSKVYYNDNLLQNMINKLYENIYQREELLYEVTPDNEGLVILDSKIEAQTLSIRKAIDLIIIQKEKNSIELKDQINLLELKLLTLPEKELELRVLYLK